MTHLRNKRFVGAQRNVSANREKWNEKWKEKLHTWVFLLHKIYLDNFGMFHRGILLSANLLFLMSEILNIYKIRITYSWLVKDFDSMFWWWWQLRRRLRRRCWRRWNRWWWHCCKNTVGLWIWIQSVSQRGL